MWFGINVQLKVSACEYRPIHDNARRRSHLLLVLIAVLARILSSFLKFGLCINSDMGLASVSQLLTYGI